MPAKYSSIIRNYVLSVSSQRKYNLYHQNTLLDALRTNSRNIIGRNPSMVIPLLVNQDLTPVLTVLRFRFILYWFIEKVHCVVKNYYLLSSKISAALDQAPASKKRRNSKY